MRLLPYMPFIVPELAIGWVPMDDLTISGFRVDYRQLGASYVNRIPALRSLDELEFGSPVVLLT